MASHLRLMSSVGKTTRRRGDCSVMTGGSITGDRMGRAVVRMPSGWHHGLNPYPIMREAGSVAPRGPRAVWVGYKEEQARETNWLGHRLVRHEKRERKGHRTNVERDRTEL